MSNFLHQLLRTTFGFVALCALSSATLANIDMPPADTTNPDYEIGVEAVKASDWPRAVTHLAIAIRAEPDNAQAHNGLAYAYRKQGKLDLAFKHYREALRLNPGLLSAHEYIGEAYVQAGDKAKAREHLAKLEQLCGRGCEEYKDLAAALAKAK